MLQILLVYIAWRRGWKAYALVPPAITYPLVWIIGVIARASDASMNDVLPIALGINGIGLFALAVMSIVGRKEKAATDSDAFPAI